MRCKIAKISTYGSAHPVVARLVVQTQTLLGWADLSAEEKGEVFDRYCVMKGRLVRCHEVHRRLDEALKKSFGGYQPVPHGRGKFRPHIIGLKNELDTFLCEGANLLRDVLGVVNIFFGTSFTEAAAFCAARSGGQGQLGKWAADTFGSADPFAKLLAAHQPWLGELIRKRDAVEHPGGTSGALTITNIEQAADGRFAPPMWRRGNMAPTRVFPDIKAMLENLLALAEDVLVACISHKNTFGGMIAFSEIAEADRDPDCPIRMKLIQTSM